MAVQRYNTIVILFLFLISFLDRYECNLKFYAQAFTLVPLSNLNTAHHFGSTPKTRRPIRVSISSTLPSSINGRSHNFKNTQSSPSHIFASLLQEDITKENSSKLVSLLVSQWNSKTDDNNNDDIDILIQALVDSKTEFDPKECIFGDFFMTIYFSGTTPLWERISQIGPSIFGNANKKKRKKNIKGQKYYIDDSLDVSSEEKEERIVGRVINYAEVFGKALQLRAYGGCELRTKNKDKVSNPSLSKKSSSGSPLDNFLSFFKNDSDSNNKLNTNKSLLQCPVDYVATIEKGTIVLFNNEIDIKVEGTGILRVLYADPNMRIFRNVYDEENADTQWEQDGLRVVQIRKDLIDPHFSL